MEKRTDIRQHCPEVESLMSGKMPFVTRYGITLVVIALTVAVLVLLMSEGSPQQFVTDMINHTIKQITSKI